MRRASRALAARKGGCRDQDSEGSPKGCFWVVDVPDVDVHFELPDDVRVAVDHARATTAEAKRLATDAADEYRQAVRDLVVNRGMNPADVAALLQVSQKRVSQLAR